MRLYSLVRRLKTILLLHLILVASFLLSCSHGEKTEKVLVSGIDAHMHLKPDGELPLGANRALIALDSANFSHGCVLSQGYLKRYGKYLKKYKTRQLFSKAMNDWTLEESKKSPRLIPFCGVPLAESWSIEELNRCIRNGGKGLKLHPVREKKSLLEGRNSKSLKNILKVAAGNFPVLIHLNFLNKKELESFFDIVRSEPKAKVIAAHGLGPNIEALKSAPKNLYIEISGLTMAPKIAGPFFVEMWRQFGINKVLMGSDWPIFHPAEHLHLLHEYPLTSNEKELILYRNAADLFKIEQTTSAVE